MRVTSLGDIAGLCEYQPLPGLSEFRKVSIVMIKFAARRLAIGTVAAAAALVAAPWVHAQGVKTVGVTAIVDHPALDSVRKGVEDELKALGWEEGKNLKLSYQSAQGNTATAGQIARKFAGDKVDAIVAIATPSAQAAGCFRSAPPII